MSNKLLFRLAVLVTAMMCALDASAAKAYVFYTSSDSTLTFYYDNLMWSREGGLPGELNTGDNDPAWLNGNFQLGVAHVVFDPSFANARQRTMFAWFKDMTNLRTIEGWENLNTSHVTNMRGLFYGCSKLTSVDLSHFNTEVVTDMGYMFYDCNGLTSLDLSSFITFRVKYLDAMFEGCSGLTSLDLSNFDTSSVTDMECMFSGCSGLTSLDLSEFNTTKVTSMTQMFYNCSNLITVYVSSAWSVSKVIYSTNMFRNCSRIVGGMGTTYNTNHLDKFYARIDGGQDNPGYFTEKAGAVIIDGEAYVYFTSSDSTLTFYYDDQMWSREGGLPGELNTGDNDPAWLNGNFQLGVAHVVFDPSFANARQRTMFAWFKDMTNLRTIEGWENLNTSHVTNMRGLFYGCSKLTSVDLSHFNTEVVTDMGYMFYDCNGLTSLDLSSFITFRVKYLDAMFEGCSGLTSLDLSNFDTSSVTDMEEMFNGCSNLTTIYVGNDWSTASVKLSSYMFYNCTSLVGGMGTTYNASYVDKAYAHIDGGTDNPGYLSEKLPEAYACYTPENTTLTFYYDKQRSTREGTTYDLNEGSDDPIWYTDGTNPSVTQVAFDASFADARPTSTKNWFRDMSEIQSISGLEYLNTENVTDMSSMFYGCSSITSLDLSHFNTAKVKNMGGLFRDCSGLKSVNLSGFITASVSYMNQMFYGCSNLTSLDLSSFNTRVVVFSNGMFMNCNNLVTIYASDEWSTQYTMAHSGMFTGCTSLVGGMGTTYDPNHVDAAYAHIDGGPSNPGYFTEKPEAYAVYTAENTTLTFYCDNQRNSRPGTAYDLNTGSNKPGWYDDGTRSSVTQVVFDSSFAAAYPTTTSSWFRGMYRLQSPSAISGMEYLNTEEVTNMSYMFGDCNGLTGLDLSHFNTAKVTDMTCMFDACSQLFLVYVGRAWNTDAVTQSSNMFFLCNKLKGGQGTYYNSSNPRDKTYAHIDGGPSNPGYFRDRSISEAYTVYTQDNQTLSFYYDTQRLTRPGTTYDVFPNAGWYNKDLVVKYVVFDQSFELVYPTSTHNWFNEMRSLESITGIRYLKTDSVTDMSYMFFECGLSSLEMNDYLSYFNTANVKRMEWMFEGCNGLTTLDLTNFNTANVTDMSYMFDGCNYLTTIYVGDGWSNESVTNSEKMFMYCISLVGGRGTTFDYDHVDGSYAHIDGGPSNPGYFTEPEPTPEAYACYTPDNTTLTFYYDGQRASRLGATYDLNTGALQPDWVLDGTNHSVTQAVIDPSFVEARPTSTHAWFYCMENVQSITGLDYLNTDSVTDMAAMFMGSAGLTSLDLSHFNTTMVTDMFNMFYECSNLASLDVSGFNTAQVRDMRGMFRSCSKLTTLDLGSFNTAKVENMNSMFSGDAQLATIYAGDGWSLAEAIFVYDMFQGCTSLVGGQGTTYDANHVDGEYAHIDGGTSNPGYFTAASGTAAGDVNGDTTVNIADVTALIDMMMNGGTPPAAADVNGDGAVNISDVTALIDYLLSGTW